MIDITERLRGNAPLLFDDRIAAADEIERLREALREICAVDKAAPGRKDCQIWADMLAIASYALTGRDSFMSLDELMDSAPADWQCTCGQFMSDHFDRCSNCKGLRTWTQVATASAPRAGHCNHFPGQVKCEWCTVAMCCLDYPRCDCNSPPEPEGTK